MFPISLYASVSLDMTDFQRASWKYWVHTSSLEELPVRWNLATEENVAFAASLVYKYTQQSLDRISSFQIAWDEGVTSVGESNGSGLSWYPFMELALKIASPL